uniref:preprotein translocase subunit SecA n=1 Tax=Blattabacterium cuenoti TaxID=1653831 RepID=UPI00163D2511|nr:helicase-related protein [Blattabacterium cuenoti]
MNFITSILRNFFLNKHQKDLKEINVFLKKIKKEEQKICTLSNDKLRNRTQQLKNLIKTSLERFFEKERKLFFYIKNSSESIKLIEGFYSDIKKLRKECYKEEQKILIQILPEAFSIIKETAKRFKKNRELIVKSTPFDIRLSQKKSYVSIRKDKAIWKNNWNVCGRLRNWNMVHYDEQLMGGVVLHHGKIAEMATGEGKTFVATLSSYLNALSGKGVHIVTVNNYLSKRDSEWMSPLMEFHQLTVDCIDNYASSDVKGRKQAYQSDITYGTNNEFGFDYLRDNMVNNKNDLVQRNLNYAIIDEIDSVLIDEARTPLIISGPVDKKKDNKKDFELFRNQVFNLVYQQNQIVHSFLKESKVLIKKGSKEIGAFKLFQAHRGLPKKKSLLKFLSKKNIRLILQKIEDRYMQDYGREMYKVDQDLYFVIDEKNNTVELTDKGIEFLSKNVEDKEFFILPDVNLEFSYLEKMNLPKDEEIQKKEKLLNIFSIKSKRIHTIHQLLKAFTLFERDVDYVLMNGKIKIVDEQTGRIMEGRRYSDGLHQAIEAKENVAIALSTQTFANITLQNYFRMYKKICGMTGTAETESGEFWHIYKLDVVVIPTHKPLKRKDFQDLVFKTKREKYHAVIEKIISLSTKEKRPVLVGTTSVEVSEFLSRSLKFRKISHNVLNAKLHEKEADIIEKAGCSSVVTIATNMAGRGTDIKLTDEVVNCGGLAVLGTERHDSRRIDNQLRGRSGRQGDPGTTQFYVSLEDNLIRLFIDSERISNLMETFGHKEGEIIQHPLLTKSIEKAQKKIEYNNFSIRKRLLDYDDVINKQREFIYKRRKNALFLNKIDLDISNMIYFVLDYIIHQHSCSFKDIKYEFYYVFGIKFPFEKNDFHSKNDHHRDVYTLYKLVMKKYKEKKNDIIQNNIHPYVGSKYLEKYKDFYYIQMIFSDRKQNSIYVLSKIDELIKNQGKSFFSIFEKNTIIFFMDEVWKEHLREMDNLRFSVQNAVFEQKDPLIVYKQNAFNLFQERIYEMNRKILSFLIQSNISNKNICFVPNKHSMDKIVFEQNKYYQ